MSLQQHESGDLQDLIRVLGELVAYCEAFDVHAQGAAHAVAGQWKGMANAEFMHQVGVWAAGAAALRAGAQDLHDWAAGAAELYDSAQTESTAMWRSA